MANTVSDTLKEAWNKLPSSIDGNGQNFIFTLKNLLGTLTEQLNDKFEEISNIANSITDAPDTITQQLKNCKIEEVRIGTAISFILTWDYSDIENYDSAELYIKETKGDIADIIDWSQIEVSRTIRTTKTNTYTVDGINAGYIYQITFQGKNTFGSVSEKESAPTLIYAVSAMNNSPDPPLEFDVYFNRDGVLWKWRQPDNLDYSYSELRVDPNVGNSVGLLEVTQDTVSTVLPPTREGTAYLYNKGYGTKYSTAITKPWSKPVPTAPQDVQIETTYQGLQISYSTIPEDCIGVVISINGLRHYTSDDKFNYYCSTGTYTVKVCYYDCFGDGTWSEEQTIETIEEIPPDAIHITDQVVFDNGVIIGAYIGDHEIVGTKIQDGTITTQNIAAGAITANQIGANAVTTDKLDANAVTSDKIEAGAITTDKLDAEAITADKLASNAVTAGKIAADAIGADEIKSGAITSEKIKAESITASNIASGAITSDKINVNSLSAISSTIGTLRTKTTGARVEIHDNLIQVYDSNNRLRVRIGVW